MILEARAGCAKGFLEDRRAITKHDVMAARALCIDQANEFTILLSTKTRWPEVDDACWENWLLFLAKGRTCDCLQTFCVVFPACGELMPQTSKYLRTSSTGSRDSADDALEAMRALYTTDDVKMSLYLLEWPMSGIDGI